MRGIPARIPAGVQRGLADTARATVSTGFASLDACLAGQGWPQGILTEIRSDHTGIGELRLLMPVVAHLSQDGGGIIWVAPPYRPYAPSLVAHQVALERVLLVHPRTHKEALWAVYQALMSPGVGAVISWFDDLQEREFRTLQRAAAQGGHVAFCVLPSGRTALPSRLRLILTPAADGLRIDFARPARHRAPITLPLPVGGR
ncbi:MAG: translesion DNA synthesis-associated protein ImuA [Acidiferrobacter sp.]